MAEAHVTENQMMAIQVHDVWKSYGSVHVLKGLSLSVPQGKTIVILGRSGVGKSVLLRQLLGIEKPDRGSIIVQGHHITKLKQESLYKIMGHFGMLFQSSALFDSLSIFENVAFYLLQHGIPHGNKTHLKDMVATALKKVGLEGYENKMPSELSGGQKRRAALARLIIYKPKIMLYDEPTTGLDPITAMQINELIIQTHQELNATTVVVTHDIRSALEIGDIFALHSDGKIAFIADKEQFIQRQEPFISGFFTHAIIPERYAALIHKEGQHV